MLPDRVSNPGPLTYESGALPIALRGPERYCCKAISGAQMISQGYGIDRTMYIKHIGSVSFFMRSGSFPLNIYELGLFHANRTTQCLRNQGRTNGEGWSTAN